MSLQSLRSRLKNLERERGLAKDGDEESSNNGGMADHTQLLNRVEQNGNRPEDWLELLHSLEQQTKNVTDSDTIKCTYLSNLYARAMKVIPADLGKNNAAYAQIMISCANFKSTYNPEDARSMFSHARYFARGFALVHVALAQFELGQGNRDKAVRVLQKAKEFGAQPTAMLSAAYKNLMLNCDELLSESDKQLFVGGNTPKICEDKENREPAVDLLRPKLSWRRSDTGLAMESKSEEDRSQEPPTNLLLPKPSWRRSDTHVAMETQSREPTIELLHPKLSCRGENDISVTMATGSSCSSREPTLELLQPKLSWRPNRDVSVAMETDTRSVHGETQSRDSTIELLQPKLSWRRNNKTTTKETAPEKDTISATKTVSEGVGAFSSSSASQRMYTDILKPVRVRTDSSRHPSNGGEDERHLPDSVLTRPPLHPHHRVSAATPTAYIPGESASMSSRNEVDGIISFQTGRYGRERLYSSDEADTLPLASHDANKVPCDASMRKAAEDHRALRSCHSTPDCKNPGVLSSRPFTSNRKNLGKPMRVPKRCSLPQLQESNTQMRDDTTGDIKLTPMPDIDSMDTSVPDTTIPCVPSGDCDSGCDTHSSGSNEFASFNHERQHNQVNAHGAMDCVPSQTEESGRSSGACVPKSSTKTLTGSSADDREPQQQHQQHGTLPQPVLNQGQRSEQGHGGHSSQGHGGHSSQGHGGHSSQPVGQVQEQPQSFLQPLVPPQTPQQSGIPMGMMGGQPQMYPYGMPMNFMHTPIGKQGEMMTINGKMYMVLKLIGRGGSSKVYEVLDPNNNLRAVKRVSLDGADQLTVNSYCNEIKLLKRLQYSDKIIKLFDFEYSREQKLLYVVMERGDTDLASFFRAKKKLGSLPRKFYWSEMLEAVQVLHKEGIVHSDLKPANFLLVAGNLKLIDFGIANTLQQDMTSITLDQQVGTLNYMSPEAIMDSQCGSNVDEHGRVKPKVKIGVKSDVWSLGCILYNVVYGKTPFQQISNQLLKLQAIINPNYIIGFPDIAELDLLDTLKKCLIRDPKQRPTIVELLEHPYVTH